MISSPSSQLPSSRPSQHFWIIGMSLICCGVRSGWNTFRSGIHQPQMPIRRRCFYLFNRFIVHAKIQIQSHATTDFVHNVLAAMQDVLALNAELVPTDSSDDDPLSKTVHTQGPFDSQLYLFEAVGILVSVLNQSPAEQSRLLDVSPNTMLEDLQNSPRHCRL